MAAQPTEPIRCSTVEISENGISEYDRNIKILSIPKKHIRAISLERGTPVERPMAQVAVGIALLVVGIVLGVWPLVNMLSKGDFPVGYYSLRPFAFAVPLILIGFWFLMRLFKKRYFLFVETETARRKIVFKTAVSDQEVRLFVERANKSFGLNIPIRLT